MRAIVQNAYGSPAVLELKEIDKPLVKDDGVLVRVHAAALHAGDYFIMRGVPYLARFAAGWPKPKDYVPGLDLAGHVEAVGRKVTRFQPGDEVFGMGRGTLIPNSAHAGMGYIVKALVRSAFVRQQGRPFVSMPNNEDLAVLKELIETGKVTPVIDRTYRLSETPEALGYVGQGHARGKVVITI
jgi:NADPH:quinone reductase-like Zn-dependent oxidoreductase